MENGIKINDFYYEKDDIITTDKYLNFCKSNSNISYIKIDYFYIGNFIWRGKLHPTDVKNICITGHSDYPLTETIANKFKLIFGTNRQCDSNNCFALPLGIGNYCEDSPLHKIYGDTNILIDIHRNNTQKENLSYMNFNPDTYPTERNYVFDKFYKNSWTNVGSIENTLNGRIKYLQEIKKSKFVFCPRGNGIDTHRLWETLYVGSIPIVKFDNNAHHMFLDLPILFVENWDCITEEFLFQKYNEFINKKWNMTKLKFEFWENFINKSIC